MRKKKELSWQQKVYGVIVIILIVWMLIYNMVNGRVQDEAVPYGGGFSIGGETHDINGSQNLHPRRYTN